MLDTGITKIDTFYFNLKQFTPWEGRCTGIEAPPYISRARGINSLSIVRKTQGIRCEHVKQLQRLNNKPLQVSQGKNHDQVHQMLKVLAPGRKDTD